MVREIVKDEAFLSQVSLPADENDIQVGTDLLDTLRAHRDGCVGLAANMIGVLKCVIVFENGGEDIVMFNPEIIRKDGPFEAEEGCLSLEGTRKTRRWKNIKVRYQNEKMQVRLKTFSGFPAQIIQHEIDHCRGIII